LDRKITIDSHFNKSSTGVVKHQSARLLNNSDQGSPNVKHDNIIYARARPQINLSRGSLNRKMAVNPNTVGNIIYPHGSLHRNLSRGILNKKMAVLSFYNRSSANNYKRARANLAQHHNFSLQEAKRIEAWRNHVRKINAQNNFRDQKYGKNNIKRNRYTHHRRYKKEPPMQRILHSLGEYFGRYVDDPRLKELHDFRKYVR
jgi:hypothetical protein